MGIPVLYEDEGVLVLDKPVGVSVSEETGKRSSENSFTIKDWVKTRYGYRNPHSGSEDEFEQRYGIVHRLDKETSGVLLVARDKEIFQYLKGLFKFRRVQKEYQVLVYGTIEDEKFEISAPIGRQGKLGTSYTVDRSGRESTTEFCVLQKLGFITKDSSTLNTTYLKAFPKTGRTHQIRVHLRALGHPVVNDAKYAGRLLLEDSDGLFGRMMLHAKRISFLDWDGKERVYESFVSLSDFFKR